MQTELLHIPVNKIRANPVALRGVDRTTESFLQLADSVRQYGVQQAISVRRKPAEDGKEYELIDGLQRYTASLETGKETIAAQVFVKEDADALLAQIIGNAHKIETKPVEYAKALMRILASNPTWTEAQLAATLNKSPTWINKQLGLTKIHPNLQGLVNEGRINLSNAFSLSKLPPDEQLNWADRAQTEDVTKFGEAALARSKEIRAANRKGEAAAPEQFTPMPHIRKKGELEEEMANPRLAPDLVRANDLTNGLKNNAQGLAEAAMRGFQLGLKWALNMDPASVEQQKVNYENRKKQDAEAKIRRDAERADKKQKEAAERADQAKKDAEAAREKAAALPAVPV